MPQNENSENQNPQKIVQTAGRAALGEFAPDFARFNDDILFGENWNNHDIDLKTRCIITVAALMSQGITDSSLKYHLENAKKNGVTRRFGFCFGCCWTFWRKICLESAWCVSWHLPREPWRWLQ